MTCLKCSVENCANYKEHRCCLPEIRVKGKDSDSRYSTCCDSFVPAQQGARNHMQYDVPNIELEIHCTAEQCVHHREGGRCDADCVCVGTYSHHSCCSAETQCETFAKNKLENIHDE